MGSPFQLSEDGRHLGFFLQVILGFVASVSRVSFLYGDVIGFQIRSVATTQISRDSCC